MMDLSKKVSDAIEELLQVNFDSVGRKIGNSFPPVDIIEEDDHFKLYADLPGMNKEDFRIDVESDTIIISGDKKGASSAPVKNRYCHFERSYGPFRRSFNLPENADSNSIEAFYKDGVLEIIGSLEG